jgi:hypothetical protein
MLTSTSTRHCVLLCKVVLFESPCVAKDGVKDNVLQEKLGVHVCCKKQCIESMCCKRTCESLCCKNSVRVHVLQEIVYIEFMCCKRKCESPLVARNSVRVTCCKKKCTVHGLQLARELLRVRVSQEMV